MLQETFTSLICMGDFKAEIRWMPQTYNYGQEFCTFTQKASEPCGQLTTSTLRTQISFNKNGYFVS